MPHIVGVGPTRRGFYSILATYFNAWSALPDGSLSRRDDCGVEKRAAINFGRTIRRRMSRQCRKDSVSAGAIAVMAAHGGYAATELQPAGLRIEIGLSGSLSSESPRFDSINVGKDMRAANVLGGVPQICPFPAGRHADRTFEQDICVDISRCARNQAIQFAESRARTRAPWMDEND